MKVGVLGASGRTGRELVAAALESNHEVTALVRDPASYSGQNGVAVVAIDLRDATSLAQVGTGLDALVSGLGASKGSPDDILATGARAAVTAAIPRMVWLGAFGTGRSAAAAGRFTSGLLRLVLGGELADKAAADELLLPAGATVFHAGPLNNSAVSSTARVVPLDTFRRSGPFPRGISRATVARLMIAEVEQQSFDGQVVIPLE